MTSRETKLDKIWEKGAKVGGKSAQLYRRDEEGRIIYKHSYGKTSSMGWEVHHKRPRSKGGTDSTRNLIPLHCRSHRGKSGRY